MPTASKVMTNWRWKSTFNSAPIRCTICESPNYIALGWRVEPITETENWRDEFTKAPDAGVEEIEKLKSSTFIKAAPTFD